MHRNDKKLRLSIATVKSLGDDDLRGVAGGARGSEPYGGCNSEWWCTVGGTCTEATCDCSMTDYPPCDPSYTNLCPAPQTDGCPISF